MSKRSNRRRSRLLARATGKEARDQKRQRRRDAWLVKHPDRVDPASDDGLRVVLLLEAERERREFAEEWAASVKPLSQVTQVMMGQTMMEFVARTMHSVVARPETSAQKDPTK